MKPVEGIRDPWDRVQALAEQCLVKSLVVV